MRLQRFLNAPALTPASAALDHARTCVRLHADWAPVVAGCDERALGVGEDVADMGASAYVAAYSCDGNLSHLVQVLVCTP